MFFEQLPFEKSGLQLPFSVRICRFITSKSVRSFRP